MPVAAVPEYLAGDFRQASPGQRFGLFLPIWTTREDQEREVNRRANARSREGDEVRRLLERQGMDATIRILRARQPRPLPGLWEKNDFAARDAWRAICALTGSDKALMEALGRRQDALGETIPGQDHLRLQATAIAPFTTGLGNEHPLENGFAFLNPYGLPYLPGSGIKGVLRQAARELASGEWSEGSGWSHARSYPLTVGNGERRRPLLDKGGQAIQCSVMDVLFGRETEDGDTHHVRGALSFWDAIPQIAGDALTVDIMTPHQSHYYQGRDAMGSHTPHESGQPNPISFLTVPVGSGFSFHVVCDRRHLARLAPDLARDDAWKALMGAAFAHAFAWLGFGAKTAVGYGVLRDAAVPSQAEDRKHRPSETWSGVTLTFSPGNGQLTVTFRGQSARALNPEAQRLRESLPEDARGRLGKRKELKGCTVEVVKVGNAWSILSIRQS